MARELADTFIRALHRLEDEGDLEAMVGLYAEDAELGNPSTPTPQRGPEGARTFWSTYRETFDRIHSDFRNVAEGGETVMLEWSSHGTLAGEEVRYDGVSVVEFQDGRVRRFRAYFDPADLRRHLPDAAG